MSKQSGLGGSFYLAGYDLSGDIQSFTTSGGPALLDSTAINQLANARLPGLRSGTIDQVAYFDKVNAHVPLSALPTTDVQVMLCPVATVLGAPALAQISKQLNYDPTRDVSGNLTEKTETESNAYGQEWGVLLTPGIRTDTTATNGTGVDQTTVSTAFGFQAYLQVFAITGTSVTVTLQDSADNVTFANITSGAFTAVAAANQTQRLTVGGTGVVRRYVRAVTSGTFTNAQFAVMFVRNPIAVSF